MTNRSDVSKMLVSHHSGRPGSVVSSSSHQRSVSSRITDDSRKKQRTSATAASTDNHHISEGSRNDTRCTDSRLSAPTSSLVISMVESNKDASNRLTPTSKTSSSGRSHGFIQMKFLEILKSARAPLSIHDIQISLGPEYNITADKELLARLKGNPRVHVDPITKRWSFRSPYQNITRPDSILSHLKHKGFEINSEALEYNKDIAGWVNQLLVDRRCRAVRGTRVARCKVFSSESGFFCDLYSPDTRCEACKSLQGVILYPLGPESIENVVVDSDLKELWHKVPQKSLAELEAFIGVDRRKTHLPNSEPRSNKRKPVGGRTGKVQKIANMHMYTREDISEALAMTTY